MRQNLSEQSKQMKQALGDIKNNYVKPVRNIAAFFGTSNDKNEPEDYIIRQTKKTLGRLPDGLVDTRYRQATESYLQERPPAMHKRLKEYWEDHQTSTKNAEEICEELQRFLSQAVAKYAEVQTEADLTDKLQEIVNGLDVQVRHLHKFLKVPINWSESIMNRELALARSERFGDFDVAELVHAARIVSRSPPSKHASEILETIDVVCKVQHPDGNWPCSQPFYWTGGGLAGYPHSAEVAWALVSIMRTLTADPEKFGMGPSEALARLEAGNQALQKYLGWLTANVREYAVPELLRVATANPDKPRQIFGWSTDRTPEPGLVHAWATANVAEFLVEYRTYLQDQINAILRVQFLSYHPKDLEPLAEFHPPDLSKLYKDRVGTWLWHQLQPHTQRTLRETQWIPGAKYGGELELEFGSAILAGPPGSAKSFLAKRIAGELQWPLIVLSPSDFLSAGEGEVEARARQIFNALAAGSRLVYFFDEIDELILDRAYTQKEHIRSVFSFLTPSFLTKPQDLREAATQKCFVFFIGTNYLDRIDPAAKRTGRIDKKLLILYPDAPSRRGFIVKSLTKALVKDVKDIDEEKNRRERIDPFFSGEKDVMPDPVAAIVNASALLSLPGLKQLCEQVSAKFNTGGNH